MGEKIAERNTDQRLLEFLIAEFETMPIDPGDPRGRLGQEIVARFRKDPFSYSKSDIYKLDSLILSLQPTERLVQRAETLRLKYAEIAGAKIASAYRPAVLPSPENLEDKTARNLLLADLQQVLQFIHWSYFFIPIREKIRSDVIKVAIQTMVGYTVLWAIVLGICMWKNFPFFGLVTTVVYAGLMGGFISSQRRMQMIPTQGDPLSSIYELENGRYFLWFAPLTGAVFSVILMLLFMSEVISGSIFPKFVGGGAPENLLPEWKFFSVHPAEVSDYARLFLWSFVAGFAERFVPDALDRLISRGATTEIGGRAANKAEVGASVVIPSGSQRIPQVKSVKPASGPVSGNTDVVIDGTGFAQDAIVTFGSTPARKITQVSETQMICTTPPGDGTVNVIVTAGGGSSAKDQASEFTYLSDVGDLADDESESHICDLDVPIQDVTEDDELPAAKGGVA